MHKYSEVLNQMSLRTYIETTRLESSKEDFSDEYSLSVLAKIKKKLCRMIILDEKSCEFLEDFVSIVAMLKSLATYKHFFEESKIKYRVSLSQHSYLIIVYNDDL